MEKNIMDNIKYNAVLGSLKTLSAFYSLNPDDMKSHFAYRLSDSFKHKDSNYLFLSPDLIKEFSSIDLSHINESEFKNIIEYFANLLIKVFPSYNLTNLYNNINSLIVNDVSLTNKGGRYNSKDNTIDVDNKYSIYHELFHMASSTFVDNINYSGFHQSSNYYKMDIGRGLNEGYTEILTHRYFGDKIQGKYGAYLNEIKIAHNLEKIIEQEKMEMIYLNSDLNALIDELKKYSSEEEILNFITMVDFFSQYMGRKVQLLFKENMIKYSYKSIVEFLIKTYSIKLRKMYENGEIKYADFELLLTDYIKSIDKKITINKQEVDIITNNMISDFIKSSLGKTFITIIK